MTAVADLYTSFDDLQLAYDELLDRHDALTADPREVEQFWTDVADYMRCAGATGSLLHDSRDRRAAQSMLDYWGNTLFRASRQPPEIRLASFDEDLAQLLAPDLSDKPCPYRGLSAFAEEDQTLFFGRERLVAELGRRLLAGTSLLVVVGPSGSGKSSLVRAGLTPKLHEFVLGSDGMPLAHADSIDKITIVPGPDPMANLRHSLARLRGDEYEETLSDASANRNGSKSLGDDLDSWLRRREKPLFLVVDQFEEIFTLCADENHRQEFADTLVRFISEEQLLMIIVLTMRIDFIPNLAKLEQLYSHFRTARVDTDPLDVNELRNTIESPAVAVGLKYDDGIVDDIVSKILGIGAALPLLQVNLLQLWENRNRNRVTWEVYNRIGDPLTALERTADDFYKGLIPQQQFTVDRIFREMIHIDPNREPTSKRMDLADAFVADEARERVEEILHALICKVRLVKISGMAGRTNICPDNYEEGAIHGLIAMQAREGQIAQIEFAHEALIRNWTHLVDLADEKRAELAWRWHLARRAEEWLEKGRPESMLLWGEELQRAQVCIDQNDAEEAFIRESAALRSREEDLREQQRQNELDALRRAKEEAEKRRNIEEERVIERSAAARRYRLAAIAAVVFFMLALVFAFLSLQKRYEVAVAMADYESRIALERIRTTPGNALADTFHGIGLTSSFAKDMLPAAESTIRQGILFVDGMPLVAGSASETESADAPATKAIFDDSGRWLVVFGRDIGLKLWSVAQSQPPRMLFEYPPEENEDIGDGRFGQPILADTLPRNIDARIVNVQFSPSGRWLAAIAEDDKVRLWELEGDVDSYEPRITKDPVHVNGVVNLAIDRLGKWMVTKDLMGTAQIYSLEGEGDLIPVFTRSGDKRLEALFAVFHPNEPSVFMGGGDRIDVCDLSDMSGEISCEKYVDLVEGKIAAMELDPMFGKWLVTSDISGSLWIRNVSHTDKLPVALVTGSLPGNIPGQKKTKDKIPGNAVTRPLSPYRPFVFSPDGNWLASAGGDETVEVWRLSEGMSLDRPFFTLRNHEKMVDYYEFSPDGKWLATVAGRNQVCFWNLLAETPESFCSQDGFSQLLGLGEAQVMPGLISDGIVHASSQPEGNTSTTFSFGDNGSTPWLATWGTDEAPELWELRFLSDQIVEMPYIGPRLVHGHDAKVDTLQFSPDGKWLITVACDGSVRILDLTSDWWKANPSRLPEDSREDGTQINALAVSPDGTLAAIRGPVGQRLLWSTDLPSSQSVDIRLASGEDLAVTFAALDLDGSVAAFVDEHGYVYVWHSIHGVTRPEQLLPDPLATVTALVMSGDGQTLAVAAAKSGADGSERGQVVIWELAEGESGMNESVNTIAMQSPADVLALSHDGRWLATVTEGLQVDIWNLANNDVDAQVSFRLDSGQEARAVAFSQNVNWFAVAGSAIPKLPERPANPVADKQESAGFVSVWKIEDEEDLVLKEFANYMPGHKHPVAVLSFSPGNPYLVSGAIDGELRLWVLDDKANHQMARLVLNDYKVSKSDSVTHLAFDRDGKWMGTAAMNGPAMLWDLESPELSLDSVVVLGEVCKRFESEDCHVVLTSETSAWRKLLRYANWRLLTSQAKSYFDTEPVYCGTCERLGSSIEE